MGCGISGDPAPEVTGEDGAELLDTFLKLESEIWREERTPPAPALGQEMVRLSRAAAALEAAQSEDHLFSERDQDTSFPGSLPDVTTTSKADNENDGIGRVLTELGINRNPELASEHEEFIANLNRRAMKELRVSWLRRRRDEAQEAVDRLTERVHHLQTLYENQETILRRLEVDQESLELARVRSYRDALYSGEMCWRDAAGLVQGAAVQSETALLQWNQTKHIENEDRRWELGVEARRGLQEAALCIQTAQTALSGVQFPYCTPREVTTLLQVLEYIFTDMQIPERHSHASQMYTNFQKRAVALQHWINKMIDNTIHQDLMDADLVFGRLVTKVANQRLSTVKQILSEMSVGGTGLAVRVDDWSPQLATESAEGVANGRPLHALPIANGRPLHALPIANGHLPGGRLSALHLARPP